MFKLNQIHFYNSVKLSYEKIKTKQLLTYVGSTIMSAILIGIIAGFISSKLSTTQITEQERVYIINEYNKFSNEALIDYMQELKIKFPYIVLAQSMVETGNFTSKIFKTNHNLFGMKVATIRPTTNLGEQSGHAYYSNWKNSVIDYALWQCRVLNVIQTENQYYEYLYEHYAENKSYVALVKKIIEDNKLKDKFDEN
jgi:uncharacterized FlgJ-related protein